MKIAVASGKGGIGKTSVAVNLALSLGEAQVLDCDVEKPNAHILLQPQLEGVSPVEVLVPRIIEERCDYCDECARFCQYHALFVASEAALVFPELCHSCGGCSIVCPVEAVGFVDRVCGFAYISRTRYGPMSHARLKPGMENSGKLVSLVRQNAKRLAEERDRDLVIVDGPPGIGCPVIASLSEIDAGLVVVEATFSSIHDLKRALRLLDHFKVEPLVCVNKHDLNLENTVAVEGFCAENGIKVVGLIPFDSDVTEAMISGLPVVEYAPTSPSSKAIKETWGRVIQHLGQG